MRKTYLVIVKISRFLFYIFIPSVKCNIIIASSSLTQLLILYISLFFSPPIIISFHAHSNKHATCYLPIMSTHFITYLILIWKRSNIHVLYERCRTTSLVSKEKKKITQKQQQLYPFTYGCRKNYYLYCFTYVLKINLYKINLPAIYWMKNKKNLT